MRATQIDFLLSRLFIKALVHNHEIGFFAQCAAQVVDALLLRFDRDHLTADLQESLRAIAHVGSNVEGNLARLEELRIEGYPQCLAFTGLPPAASLLLRFSVCAIDSSQQIQLTLQFRVFKYRSGGATPSVV
jgi:hypothetical protein